MACEKCKLRDAPHPIRPLFALFCNSAMLLLLSHLTPVAGASDFFISWHWLLWWGFAILIPVNVAFFFINLGRMLGK